MQYQQRNSMHKTIAVLHGGHMMFTCRLNVVSHEQRALLNCINGRGQEINSQRVYV